MKLVKENPTPKRLIIDINPKTLSELKMIALKRNDTLKNMITDLLQTFILEEKKND